MHPDFDPPTRGQIAGRTSSITAAFFQAITPVRAPWDAEVDEVLAVLGMSPGDCRCAYCGDARTEWDHFRPIVKERQPTGYITEIANLVPSCGKCNQSKGNKNWKEWMLGEAKRSPRQRQIPDLPARVARLEAFEKWREPAWVDYAKVVGEDRWNQYQHLLGTAVSHLAEAQKMALELLKLANQHLQPAADGAAISRRAPNVALTDKAMWNLDDRTNSWCGIALPSSPAPTQGPTNGRKPAPNFNTAIANRRSAGAPPRVEIDTRLDAR